MSTQTMKPSEVILEGLKDIEKNQKEMQREVDELYARLPSTRGTFGSESVKQPISITNLARGITKDNWDGAEYEREVVEEGQRTLGQSTDTAGGYIVPAEYLASEFIDKLFAEAPAFQAGVRRLAGLRGSPVQIPKMTTSRDLRSFY